MNRLQRTRLIFFICILFMSIHIYKDLIIQSTRFCSGTLDKKNISINAIDSKKEKVFTTVSYQDLKAKKRAKISFLKEPKPINLFCPNKACLQDKETKWKMFTFIKTSAGNVNLRQAIRRTWASIHFLQEAQFYSIFVVGKTNETNLTTEHEQHGDLLHVNVSDIYRNVVYKSLASMQWASENLPGDFFFSIADDDMFIHIGWVQEYISEVRRNLMETDWPGHPILCMHGHRSNRRPVREEDNKYYSSYEEYGWPFWPNFCLGGMYTTNVETAHKLYLASRTEKIVHLEDVFITGILRRKIGFPKEYLIPVQPAAALHLESTFSAKQRPFHMIKMWTKLETLIQNHNQCSCN